MIVNYQTGWLNGHVGPRKDTPAMPGTTFYNIEKFIYLSHHIVVDISQIELINLNENVSVNGG